MNLVYRLFKHQAGFYRLFKHQAGVSCYQTSSKVWLSHLFMINKYAGVLKSTIVTTMVQLLDLRKYTYPEIDSVPDPLCQRWIYSLIKLK